MTEAEKAVTRCRAVVDQEWAEAVDWTIKASEKNPAEFVTLHFLLGAGVENPVEITKFLQPSGLGIVFRLAKLAMGEAVVRAQDRENQEGGS